MTIQWILVALLFLDYVPVVFIILLLGSYPVQVKKVPFLIWENKLKIVPASCLILPSSCVFMEKELMVRTPIRLLIEFNGQAQLLEENSLADFEVCLLHFAWKFLMSCLICYDERIKTILSQPCKLSIKAPLYLICEEQWIRKQKDRVLFENTKNTELKLDKGSFALIYNSSPLL